MRRSEGGKGWNHRLKASLIERSALLNEPRSILKRNRNSSAGKSQHGSTIAFNENENQVFSPQRVNEASSISTRADHSPPSKRRRKSSRRESLFHPSDFEFSDHEGVDRETNAQAPTATEVESPITLPTSDPEAQQKTNDPNTVGRETVLPNDSVEESCNFTNSLIDYSIPEEVLEASSVSTPSAALNKVNVYHDSTSQSETELVPGLSKPSRYASHNFENESAQDKTTQQQQPSFIQNSTSSQKKVKHSMKARGAPKKMIDEVMPTTGGSTSELSDTSRSRRTRGKAINYALPSLRAKMRRPTEKLVDATTVTNIRDLQVRTGRRKSSSKSRDSTPFENGAQIDQEVTLEVQDKKTGTEHDLNHDDTPASPSKNLEVLVDSKRSSPSENTEPKSTTKSNPLKDITNNAPAKPLGKTKKLFKKPIVGDLGDENSYSYEESSTNRSMSFRVNEEDLSVFDLLDDLKTNTLPKTHRAKAKKVADKRGRKPAFRL